MANNRSQLTSLPRERLLNRGRRQVIAEKISSTVRVLELLGYDYEVVNPRNKREKGNKSPRIVHVDVGERFPFRIYNSYKGHTWANLPNGKPVKGARTVEDVYTYLANLRK